MKQHDQMRQTVDRLLGEIVCLEWAIAAQDPWSELELRVRDMKKIAKQALSHVNETPKNKHDSDDVLKRAPLVRLTDYQVFLAVGKVHLQQQVTDDFILSTAHAIMTAMERANK